MSNDKARSQARKKRALAEEETSTHEEFTPFQAIMIALLGFLTFSIILLGGMRLVVHGYYMRSDVWQDDVMMIGGGFIIGMLTFLFMPRKK